MRLVMCFNISINKMVEYLETRFNAVFVKPDLYKPIYHSSAFNTPFIPIITNEAIHDIQLFQWGLIPFWVKDEESANKIRFNTFNAKAETIHKKTSFKFSIKNKRCLVIVDGFFEWREVKGNKFPYYIKLINDEAFSLAGIWDTWVNKETGESRNTFSIITTRANPLLEKIHNKKKRMPVILKAEDEQRWLSDKLDIDEINSILNPYTEDDLKAYTISKLISSKGQNSNVPDVLKKFDYEELKTAQTQLF